ncbi:Ykof family thiamine-binding protein [Enterococcus gallinarum]|nr:Ykof family thiamine-binding protein [Enterococcus gallinarum]
MENCSMNQIDITGCRISLYPMKDDFASHILRSIKETDTTAVWQQTDLFSTLYRGEAASVIDAAAALLSMPMTQKHIWSVSSLFRKAVQEIWLVMPFSAASMNGQIISKLLQKVRSSFSANILFYVFGREDYMEEIAHIVSLADAMGLQPQSAHYVTLLSGTAAQLFAYFEQALAYAHEKLPHYVLEGTVSVNSPSLKEASLHE